MSDKGMIFSAPMVRALLEGRKTQTRRLLKPPEPGARIILEVGDMLTWHVKGVDHTHVVRRPYAVGDRLWVREQFHPWTGSASGKTIAYDADGQWIDWGSGWTGKPEGITWCSRATSARHMSKWASRLTLTVTDVRVQLLHEITEADARAEAVDWYEGRGRTPKDLYADLWNSLHTKSCERWEDDPAVIALTFTVKHGNIDRSEA